MSKPHFLDSDAALLAPFDGELSPDVDKHDTFVHVQPDLGTTMNGQKRIQANFWVSPVSVHTSDGKVTNWGTKIKPCVFPVAWFEETGSITPYLRDKFKGGIYFGRILSHVAIAAGALLVLLAFLSGIYMRRDLKDYEATYGPVEVNDGADQPLVDPTH